MHASTAVLVFLPSALGSRDEKSRQTTGEIWAIYAAPTHWNQGVGVALWDAARDGLLEEGCTNVTSWVPLRE